MKEQARGRWFDAASGIGAALDEILELLPSIQSWIQKHRQDRNLGEIAEDLEQQLQWLFRPDFAWNAGFQTLSDYPRRLRAIRIRINRLDSLPLAGTLKKWSGFSISGGHGSHDFCGNPADPAGWAAGWAP
jgi:ATP-dependent helicase HrpA